MPKTKKQKSIKRFHGGNLFFINYFRESLKQTNEDQIYLPDKILKEAIQKLKREYRNNILPRGISDTTDLFYTPFLFNGCYVEMVNWILSVYNFNRPVLSFMSESKDNLEKIVRELGLPTSQR